MTEPIRPEDVPRDLFGVYERAMLARYEAGDSRAYAECHGYGLAALLAEVRERIAQCAEKCWPDPFGNWNAEQAEAAKAAKQQMLRAIREWPRQSYGTGGVR